MQDVGFEPPEAGAGLDDPEEVRAPWSKGPWAKDGAAGDVFLAWVMAAPLGG